MKINAFRAISGVGRRFVIFVHYKCRNAWLFRFMAIFWQYQQKKTAWSNFQPEYGRLMRLSCHVNLTCQTNPSEYYKYDWLTGWILLDYCNIFKSSIYIEISKQCKCYYERNEEYFSSFLQHFFLVFVFLVIYVVLVLYLFLLLLFLRTYVFGTFSLFLLLFFCIYWFVKGKPTERKFGKADIRISIWRFIGVLRDLNWFFSAVICAAVLF